LLFCWRFPPTFPHIVKKKERIEEGEEEEVKESIPV